MKTVAFLILLICVCASGGAVWAVNAVRISDLANTPLPPNPIRVWGTVTSTSPVRIGDGVNEIAVVGLTAAADDFVVVTGSWDGEALIVSESPELYAGPARVQMIRIAAGSFDMGNNGGEGISIPDELPQHSVYLPDYWIGKYEVTRGEYRRFIEAGGYSNPSWWSTAGWAWKADRIAPRYWAASQNWGGSAFVQTEKHPVVGVSYYEAEAFCIWAGGHLPTEAQWEKAARWTGSQPNTYPWGNTWDPEKCNNYSDHNPAGGGYQRRQTAPVGSYPSGSSPYGCQDMTGNVWEWCQDWYKSYPGSQNPFDYANSLRVLRGGGWGDTDLVFYGRCAYRNDARSPNTDSYYYGFRMAR